jgi:hypothetical protein
MWPSGSETVPTSRAFATSMATASCQSAAAAAPALSPGWLARRSESIGRPVSTAPRLSDELSQGRNERSRRSGSGETSDQNDLPRVARAYRPVFELVMIMWGMLDQPRETHEQSEDHQHDEDEKFSRPVAAHRDLAEAPSRSPPEVQGTPARRIAVCHEHQVSRHRVARGAFAESDASRLPRAHARNRRYSMNCRAGQASGASEPGTGLPPLTAGAVSL